MIDVFNARNTCEKVFWVKVRCVLRKSDKREEEREKLPHDGQLSFTFFGLFWFFFFKILNFALALVSQRTPLF